MGTAAVATAAAEIDRNELRSYIRQNGLKIKTLDDARRSVAGFVAERECQAAKLSSPRGPERYFKQTDEEFDSQAQRRLSSSIEAKENYARVPAIDDPHADEPINNRSFENYCRDKKLTIQSPEDAARAVESYCKSRTGTATARRETPARFPELEHYSRGSEPAHYQGHVSTPNEFDPLADEELCSKGVENYIRDQRILIQSPEDATRAVEGYIAARRVAQKNKK
ncbi:hypothetical protein SAMN05444166_0145 [Singulisphaera sp. GP187]|uniref:hypothetical protein n=1 Tax=Singulisphaera sp. GP187 TaxID=1882752 RepID=UPI00092659A6|nr:hypothetical protein [Singulisphaera sp. GP187]SIN69062.1 hypothetical protein SAMN05444166_0145 [Singulisphaera sp. GP187]